MAQTRKKRRSKHRGTAAGTIEARGRTGRKPTEQEVAKNVRAQAADRRASRLDRPPTWKSAFYRAVFASLVLFGLTQLGLGNDIGTTTAIALCVLALIIYVPLGYMVDTFAYRRKQKRKATMAGKAKAR